MVVAMSGLSTTERVGAALREVFSLLDDCFELSREELEYRPGYADAWTLAEHLEHVGLANHFLLLTMAKGCRSALRRAASGAPPQEGESDLDLLADIAAPRAFDWAPPAHMVPTGKRQIAEVRAELAGQREQCLALLEGMAHGEGRLYSIRMSVHGVGRLDMYQWLYFLAQHARYHLALIEERRRRE